MPRLCRGSEIRGIVVNVITDSVLNAGQKGISRRSFIAAASMAGALSLVPGGLVRRAWAEGSLTPGTYTAEAQGRGGKVEVTVTVTDSAIESIEVSAPDETERIADAALTELPQRIIDSQSIDVETITGATLTSFAVISAVSDCIERAAGDTLAFEVEVAPAHAGESETIDCDVVVVGAGGSGVSTAVSSAMNGLNVVLVEQSSNTGGNTLVSGGHLEFVNAPTEIRLDATPGYDEYVEETLTNKNVLALDDPSHIETVRQELEEWEAEGSGKVFDSATFYALDSIAHRDGGVSWESAWKYAEDGAQLTDWFDSFGVEWGMLHGIVGSPYPRWVKPAEGDLGFGYFYMYDDVIADQALPIDIKTCTKATGLIVDGDRVVGITAEGDDGMAYTINAAKGVVLATGGFAGNPDLLKSYDTTWPWDESTVIPTTNCYGHFGDGLQMCLDAGGYAANLEMTRLFPFADAKNYSVETIVGDSANCLLVNKNGERFVNESLDRGPICTAMMEQPDSMCYIISCEANAKIVDGKCEGGIEIEKMLENGQLYRADTLEELAEQMGCDPSVLVATVERYNEAAKAYNDEDFGRLAFTEESPIEEGPFYASPRTWAAHETTGGVVIDENYQPVREDGSPIEGLYAVGELTDGNYGIGTMAMGMLLGRKLAEA